MEPSTKLARAPKVNTLAKPDVGPLLAARHEALRNPEIHEVFLQAKEQGWSADVLADRLSLPLGAKLEGTPDEIYQVALYLADEYLQIGEAMLVISTTTGKAITKLTEADLWQPPMVAREGGGMAKPLPRIQPRVEGALIQWEFTKEREKRLTASLAARLNQTELLRQEGDPRLLVATTGGRKRLVEELQDALPTLLPGACQGSIRGFLDLFRWEPIEGLEPFPPCVGVARVITPIQDPKALNLKYDHLTSIKAKIAVQWARDIAGTLAQAAFGRGTTDIELWEQETLGGFWVSDPNVMQALTPSQKLLGALVVDPGSPTVLLQEIAGAIVVDPGSFECQGREFHDKWDVLAKFEYTLYVDWSKVQAYSISGVPVSGLSVELVETYH